MAAEEGAGEAAEKQPEFKRVERQAGVLFLVRTKRFQGIMDSLASHRILKPLSWFLLALMPIAGAFALILFLSDLAILLSPRGAVVAQNVRSLSILGNIGIPGLNPYIPIVYGWIALVIALVVHEGAHGVVTRSMKLPVRSSGLVFLFFIPIGAFVEPDEPALKAAPARDTERILGAGVGVNIIVALISLLLLFGVVSTMTTTSSGLWVQSVVTPSPASTAGIQPGDFIVSVNGIPISNSTQIHNSSWYKPGNVVNITVSRRGSTITFLDVKLNASGALIGIIQGDPQGLVSSYTHPSLSASSLSTYLCIPNLPVCQDAVPFSSAMAQFYSSPLGSAAPVAANLLFWIYFLNFNLAIFNALPIYPFDGGQAFQVGVKALAKDRISDEGLQRITLAATLAIAAILLIVILGPYSGLF